MIRSNSKSATVSERGSCKNLFLEPDDRQVFTGHRKLDFVVDNPTNSIAYVGLSPNSGRIIVIEPEIYGQICLLEKFILAHTSNVDLVMMNQGIMAKHARYIKVISKSQLHLLYEHVLEDESDTIKPLAD